MVSGEVHPELEQHLAYKIDTQEKYDGRNVETAENGNDAAYSSQGRFHYLMQRAADHSDKLIVWVDDVEGQQPA